VEHLSDLDRQRFLMQVGHALNMVAELPEWMMHGSLPKHLRHACADSFLMQSRFLVDFFEKGDPRKDVLVADFELTEEIAANPPDMFDRASRQVAHPSRDRVRVPVDQLADEECREVRAQWFVVLEEFAAKLVDEELRRTMRGYIATARSRAVWPVPPWPSDGRMSEGEWAPR